MVNILDIIVSVLSTAVIEVRLPRVMNLLSDTCWLKKILAAPRVNSDSFKLSTERRSSLDNTPWSSV